MTSQRPPGTATSRPHDPKDDVLHPPRRRLRSHHVAYGVVGAVVVACCGFGVYRNATEPRHCVDPQTQGVVPDEYCRDGHSTRGVWYYGGRVSGGKVVDGSFQRGGFGRVFSGGS